MKKIKFEGKCTLLSPLHISDGKSGKGSTTTPVTFTSKERILANGNFVNVPVISGNALKHLLRFGSGKAIASKMALDSKTLTAVFSGYGQHTKPEVRSVAAAPSTIKTREIIGKIERNPHLAIYGGCLVDFIASVKTGKKEKQTSVLDWVPAKIKAGIMYPIVAETSNIVPAAYQGSEELPSVGSMGGTFSKHYVKSSLKKNPKLVDALNGANRSTYFDMLGVTDIMPEVEEASSEEGETEETEQTLRDATKQLRYAVEVIPAGTELYSYIELFNPTPVEIGLLLTAFNEIAESPYIGGKSSIGHGRFKLSYDAKITDDSNQVETISNALVLEDDACFLSEDMKVFVKVFDTWLSNVKEGELAI